MMGAKTKPESTKIMSKNTAKKTAESAPKKVRKPAPMTPEKALRLQLKKERADLVANLRKISQDLAIEKKNADKQIREIVSQEKELIAAKKRIQKAWQKSGTQCAIERVRIHRRLAIVNGRLWS